MVFPFEIGDEKELSIPLIMGAILYSIKPGDIVLYSSIFYGVFAGIGSHYLKNLKSNLGVEKIDTGWLLGSVWLIARNFGYIKDNNQMKLIRGAIISIMIFLGAQVILTYKSVLFLSANFQSTNLMLVLLVTTLYSLYALFNSLFLLFTFSVFEWTIQVLTKIISGGTDEKLEERKWQD